jgi:hypothetical protein
VNTSGVHHDRRREKGRAARDAQIHDARSGRKFGRAHVAAALSGRSIIVPCRYTGTAAAEVFEDWFAGLAVTPFAQRRGGDYG